MAGDPRFRQPRAGLLGDAARRGDATPPMPEPSAARWWSSRQIKRLLHLAYSRRRSISKAFEAALERAEGRGRRGDGPPRQPVAAAGAAVSGSCAAQRRRLISAAISGDDDGAMPVVMVMIVIMIVIMAVPMIMIAQALRTCAPARPGRRASLPAWRASCRRPAAAGRPGSRPAARTRSPGWRWSRCDDLREWRERSLTAWLSTRRNRSAM